MLLTSASLQHAREELCKDHGLNPVARAFLRDRGFLGWKRGVTHQKLGFLQFSMGNLIFDSPKVTWFLYGNCYLIRNKNMTPQKSMWAVNMIDSTAQLVLWLGMRQWIDWFSHGFFLWIVGLWSWPKLLLLLLLVAGHLLSRHVPFMKKTVVLF